MRLSVVIPALNESAELPDTLARAGGADEIIVVDGGSNDGTADIAAKLGARVLRSLPGRAAQMNAGAAAATCEIILFLHADTWLQPGSLEAIKAELKNESVVGGAFHRQFRTSSPTLRFTCALASARNATIGWHLGDQALFCRRAVFQELGGFASMRAFEDLDFSRRLARRGQIVTLNPPVLASPRRFANGPLHRTVADFFLTTRYLLQPNRFRM